MITTSCLKHSGVNPSHIVPGLECVVEVIICHSQAQVIKDTGAFILGMFFLCSQSFLLLLDHVF